MERDAKRDFSFYSGKLGKIQSWDKRQLTPHSKFRGLPGLIESPESEKQPYVPPPATYLPILRDQKKGKGFRGSEVFVNRCS